MQRWKLWGLLGTALILGLLIAWVDSRPTWDDSGITAGAVLLVTALFGLALPQRAWLWALAVGSWIPAFGILVHRNYGTALALVVAFGGAYAGALLRKLLMAPIQTRPDDHSRP
jgi:hypothetical protein